MSLQCSVRQQLNHLFPSAASPLSVRIEFPRTRASDSRHSTLQTVRTTRRGNPGGTKRITTTNMDNTLNQIYHTISIHETISIHGKHLICTWELLTLYSKSGASN